MSILRYVFVNQVTKSVGSVWGSMKIKEKSKKKNQKGEVVITGNR